VRPPCLHLLSSPCRAENFLRVRTVAKRANVAPSSIYDAIDAGKIATVIIDETMFIPESEAERFIREWPSKNRGVSAHFAEYREWKRQQAEVRAA
jgi:hypothetical protein